ncbi:MAG TPA: DnaJ domain-containing protein [Chitinophagaceae bacterium]|nr:DnaJ domain-containing protein [Chitinophagaceae bacterium]
MLPLSSQHSMLKDYYDILQIGPDASLPEIKQAYRRLAMIYHPDKTKSDVYGDKYKDIREAYEVLTNPVRKDAYLQKRWYDKSIGQKRKAETVTPVSILRLSLELERYVSSLDVHRMNKEGLYNHISELISDETIATLNRFDEPAINHQIINTILIAMRPLPLNFVITLSTRLEKLARNKEPSLLQIKSSLRQYRKRFLWNKYKTVVILIITLLLCLLIYFTSE